MDAVGWGPQAKDKKSIGWSSVPPSLATDQDGCWAVNAPNLGGAVFIDGPTPDDPEQGIGNCYFIALAQRNPAQLERALRDNGDGTLTVRYYAQEERPWPMKWFAEPRTVARELTFQKSEIPRYDQDMVISSSGGVLALPKGTPLYGKSKTSAELWVSALETAYVKIRRNNSYAAAENGHPSDALFFLTGEKTLSWRIVNAPSDVLAASLDRVVNREKKPVLVGTQKVPESGYWGSVLRPEHVYAITGFEPESDPPVVVLSDPNGRKTQHRLGGEVRIDLGEFQKKANQLFTLP